MGKSNGAIFPLLSNARQVNLPLLSPIAQERNKGMKKCSQVLQVPWVLGHGRASGPQGWEQVFWIQQHEWISLCLQTLLQPGQSIPEPPPFGYVLCLSSKRLWLCRYLLHLWIVKHKSVGQNCNMQSHRNLNIDLSCKIQILNTPKFRCVGSRV